MARLGVMTTEFDLPTFAQVVDEIARRGTPYGICCVHLQLSSVIREVPTTDGLLQGLDVLGDKITADRAIEAREALTARGLDALRAAYVRQGADLAVPDGADDVHARTTEATA